MRWLRWRWAERALAADKSWKTKGWALKGRLDKEKEEGFEDTPMADVWPARLGVN